jgi:hypothetical protein
VLIVAQMLMGAANPWTTFAEWARAGHLSMATLVWVDMVFIVALILRPVPRRDFYTGESLARDEQIPGDASLV